MTINQTDWVRAGLPALKWARDKPYGYNWQFDRSDEASEEIPQLPGT